MQIVFAGGKEINLWPGEEKKSKRQPTGQDERPITV